MIWYSLASLMWYRHQFSSGKVKGRGVTLHLRSLAFQFSNFHLKWNCMDVNFQSWKYGFPFQFKNSIPMTLTHLKNFMAVLSHFEALTHKVDTFL